MELESNSSNCIRFMFVSYAQETIYIISLYSNDFCKVRTKEKNMDQHIFIALKVHSKFIEKLWSLDSL